MAANVTWATLGYNFALAKSLAEKTNMGRGFFH